MVGLLPLLATVAPGEPLFQITVQVRNDMAAPVAGAKVSVALERTESERFAERFHLISGDTNEEGLASLRGEMFMGSFAFGVEAPGYYTARGLRYAFVEVRRGRWQPWNPTIPLVLKPIKNPVAMYARRMVVELPVQGVAVGFDLLQCDWTPPHGQGSTPDIICFGQGNWRDRRNYDAELTIEFPGYGNGLVPHHVPPPYTSPLHMPYEAPEEGYQPRKVWRTVSRYDPGTRTAIEYVRARDEAENFFVRIRSEVCADGEIGRAVYGKIHAPFEFGIRPDGGLVIAMTYFLNPDGTRNIEFDPSRNLFDPRIPERDFHNLGP